MSRWFFAFGLASIFAGACLPDEAPKTAEEEPTIRPDPVRTEVVATRIAEKPTPASAPIDPSRVSLAQSGLDDAQVDSVAARMAFQGQLASRVEKLDTRRGDLARGFASAPEEVKARVKPLLERWISERKQLERGQTDLVLTTNDAWDEARDKVGSQATALEESLTEMERLLDTTSSSL